MKKILIALTIVISCIGINKVRAEDLQLKMDNSYDEYKSLIGEENINNIINEVFDEYKNTYMTAYPYYVVQLNFIKLSSDGFTSSGDFDIRLLYFSDVPTPYWSVSESPEIGISVMRLTFEKNYGMIGRKYHVYDNENYIFDLSYTSTDSYSMLLITMNSISNPKVYEYSPSSYYLSNFDLYLPPINSVKEINRNGFIFDYDNILIPKLDDSSLSTVVSFDREDYLIEPYYLYDTDVNVDVPNMTEINLNDYAYVALALKDYVPKTFETTVQVKGQYCITPVYNYGMSSYDSVVGTKVQNVCSPYYLNYTPVRTYITFDNFQNNAIYYVKASNTEQENYIKVDTSVFDITYITEEDKDNPYVYVQGKYYPTIPYDDLPSSATQNTEEGYVPGQVEEFSFSDIFTAPLEFLKDIWSSIVSVFDLVKEFFSLLPEPIPTFLLTSFMLAIALGLLKIIL